MQRTEKRGLFLTAGFSSLARPVSRLRYSLFTGGICKNNAVYGACQPQTTTSCISMVIRASGCQIRAFGLWKAQTGTQNPAFHVAKCPKSSADVVFLPVSFPKYKASALPGPSQGAKSGHFHAFHCAKLSKMWRTGALLFRHVCSCRRKFHRRTAIRSWYATCWHRIAASGLRHRDS